MNRMDFDKIIQEKWTSPLRKSYVTVHGYMFPQRYEDLKNKIDNLEVNVNDIWLCSFPKSGTTWCQEMSWLIENNFDYEGAKMSIDERFPFLELSIVHDLRDISKTTNLQPSEGVEDSIKFVERLKSPKCVMTHLPWELLPKQIQNGTKKPKIIYIARDPRDICVSFYNHCKLLDNFLVTFEEFCELFLVGKVLWGPYWNHVLPFWNMRNSPNVLFLRYEDMKTNLSKVVSQVAEFLERSLSKENVEGLVKHLSFESMQCNNAVNRDKIVTLLQKIHGNQHAGKFIRKGIVGDYKTVMSSETIKKFNEWITNNTEGTDYVV